MAGPTRTGKLTADEAHDIIGDTVRQLARGKNVSKNAFAMSRMFRDDMGYYRLQMDYFKLVGATPDVPELLPALPPNTLEEGDIHRIAEKSLDSLGRTPGK